VTEALSIGQAIFLGIVQGLTEFLPISSSGHLVILQQVMGIEAHGSFLMDFDLALHVGTLLSILVALYQEIWVILQSLGRVAQAVAKRRTINWQQLYEGDQGIKLAVMVVVGSIPVALLGLLFRDALEGLFMSLLGAGLMLFVTGGVLWLTNYFKKAHIHFSQVSLFQAFIVGMAQAFALIPGISRSGVTIVTALGWRWPREVAAKFSFLLLIPAVTGGVLLESRHFGQWSTNEWFIMLWGALAAAISGFFAIKALIYVVKQGSLRYFSYYCWAVGSLSLVYYLVQKFF
jgi:undecaprenyl-diphosphatase